MTPDVARVLLDGTRVLEALDLRYAVVGGLAVSAWALPRSTRDVDLFADLPESIWPALKRHLEERDFHVPAMDAELERFGVFRSRSKANGTFLDIFSAVGPFGETLLKRRQRLSIEGTRYGSSPRKTWLS